MDDAPPHARASYRRTHPARYKVLIDSFYAYETPSAKDYPEDAMFLRFWHPMYEDFVDILPGVLEPAKIGKTVTVELVFRTPRARFRDVSVVQVPRNAIMGVTVYARTTNTAGQRCIKQSAVIKPEVDFWKVHAQGGFDAPVKAQSMHLLSELRSSGQNQVLSTKGEIARLYVACIDNGGFIYQPYDGSNNLIKNPDLFKATMESMARDIFTPTFTTLMKPRIPKLFNYFAPQYMTAHGDIMPISSYMIRTCMKDTKMPDADAILRSFHACLDQRPELGGESEFVRIASMYLTSDAADPTNGDGDARRKWFTCMEVVASMTCIYNNAVPYLMDMEKIGRIPGASARQSTIRRQTFDTNANVDIESMVDAEKDYGHDCEDSSLNADMRKRAYVLHREGTSTLSLIGQISALFVSIVVQMACGGNDAQIHTDDGIFHFCTLLIPRAYFARMEIVGGIPPEDRRPLGPRALRAWERAYKTGAEGDGPVSHVGVLYTEGTNTVCPLQFIYDRHVESARKAQSQFMDGCAGDVAAIDQWVNVYHSNVFRTRTCMSSFYKYLICGMSGDSPHHRVRGIYDYIFVDRHGPRNTFAAQVELLAHGDDGVGLALIPKMRYTKEEIEAVESNLTFRSMSYGVWSGQMSDGLGRMSQCPTLDAIDLVKNLPEVKVGIPRHVDDIPASAMHYVRFTPVDTDMYVPARREAFVRTMRCILERHKKNIRGVYVSGHLVQYVPVEPHTMSGPVRLGAFSVIIFFDPSASFASRLRELM